MHGTIADRFDGSDCNVLPAPKPSPKWTLELQSRQTIVLIVARYSSPMTATPNPALQRTSPGFSSEAGGFEIRFTLEGGTLTASKCRASGGRCRGSLRVCRGAEGGCRTSLGACRGSRHGCRASGGVCRGAKPGCRASRGACWTSGGICRGRRAGCRGGTGTGWRRRRGPGAFSATRAQAAFPGAVGAQSISPV